MTQDPKRQIIHLPDSIARLVHEMLEAVEQETSQAYDRFAGEPEVKAPYHGNRLRRLGWSIRDRITHIARVNGLLPTEPTAEVSDE